MSITLEQVKKSEEITSYIRKADESLSALGFTEHSFAHVGLVSAQASAILKTLGYDDRTCELAAIAGWRHDIGNVINRIDHAQSGAVMAFRILDKMGASPEETPLLARVDKFPRGGEIRRFSQFDLAEDEILPVRRDDIDFAEPRAVVHGLDAPALFSQILRGQRLAPRAGQITLSHKIFSGTTAGGWGRAQTPAAPRSAALCRSPCGQRSRTAGTARRIPPSAGPA